MDDIDFLHPVKVGPDRDTACPGRGRRHQLAGGAACVCFAEDVLTGERRATLNSHLVFVKVGEDVGPAPVGAKIRRLDAAESSLVDAARARREQRLARFAERAARLPERVDDEPDPSDVDVGWRFESTRSVLPEDALFRQHDVRRQDADGAR